MMEKKETKSVYSTILDCIRDGRKFSAEEYINASREPGSEYISYKDGLDDYMHLYKGFGADIDSYIMKDIIKAVRLASMNEFEEAAEIFTALFEDVRTADFREELYAYIYYHRHILPSASVYDFALDLILESDNIELVKVGLVILTLFANKDSVSVEMLRNLGQCEEFADYVCCVFSESENGNSKIFRLLKSVSGYGANSCMTMIEPENDSIRRWILRNSLDSLDSPELSGVEIWEKSGAEELLYENIGHDDFVRIEKIFMNLYKGSGFQYFIESGSASDVFSSMIGHMKNYEMTILEYNVLEAITRIVFDTDLAEDNEYDSLKEEIYDIYFSADIEDLLHETVAQSGDGVEIADRLEIDVREDLYGFIMKDPFYSVPAVAFLYEDEEYRERALDIYRNLVSEYKDDSSKLFDILLYFNEAVRMIPYNCPDLIQAGFESDFGFIVSKTLTTVFSWIILSDMYLKDFSGEIYDLVEKMTHNEEYAELKEEFEIALNGSPDEIREHLDSID